MPMPLTCRSPAAPCRRPRARVDVPHGSNPPHRPPHFFELPDAFRYLVPLARAAFHARHSGSPLRPTPLSSRKAKPAGGGWTRCPWRCWWPTLGTGGAGTSATLDNAIKSRPNTLYVVAAGNDGVNNDTSPHTPCNPATAPGRGEQDLRCGHRLQRRARRLLELRRRQRRSRGPRRQHPEHRPDEDRLQRQLRDADRGPLEDRRRRPGRDAALGAHHAVLDQPHPQPHRLAGRRNYQNNQDNWARNTTGFNLTGVTTAGSPPRRRSTRRTTSTRSPSRPPGPPASPRAGRRCSPSTEPGPAR